MKLNDVKHNHSLTDLLKILIFSILMMVPFIDVGIRCAYVVCNKNAYQSYSGLNQNTETIVSLDTLNDFDYSKTYYLTNSALDTNLTASSTNQYYCNLIEVVNNAGSLDLSNVNRFYIYANNTNTYVNFYNNDTLLGNYANTVLFTLKMQITGFSGNETSIQVSNNVLAHSNIIYTIEYFNAQQLDNVFDYSVNKLTTSDLYTWTQQTAIYTGVQTMCAQLGINNSVIPILLVYWFILIIIYIIIDILLNLFTMLTHAIGSKTA